MSVPIGPGTIQALKVQGMTCWLEVLDDPCFPGIGSTLIL
jgi:hypothetical protein